MLLKQKKKLLDSDSQFELWITLIWRVGDKTEFDVHPLLRSFGVFSFLFLSTVAKIVWWILNGFKAPVLWHHLCALFSWVVLLVRIKFFTTGSTSELGSFFAENFLKIYFVLCWLSLWKNLFVIIELKRSLLMAENLK